MECNKKYFKVPSFHMATRKFDLGLHRDHHLLFIANFSDIKDSQICLNSTLFKQSIILLKVFSSRLTQDLSTESECLLSQDTKADHTYNLEARSEIRFIAVTFLPYSSNDTGL